MRQEVTRKRKEGSYVASAAREEFEADLADFGALAVPRYALVCVDVFSRMGAAIPLRSKSAEAMVPALDEVMRQMGTPVRFVTDNGLEFDNATVVPTAAIQTGQKGPYVYVAKADGAAELRPVKTGLTFEEVTVISEGVKSGETVVVDGQMRLYPDAKLDIKKP